MAATNEKAFLSMSDDDMEVELILDYARFAVSINVDTIITILRRARETTDARERKRLCAAGLQILYGSFEDFALLLHGMLARKARGTFLHMSLSGEGQRLGTTTFPARLKRPGPARDLFDELGFSDVTVPVMRELGYDVTDEALDAAFADFADSVKYLATSADEYNEIKNRAKHGKGIWGLTFGLDGTDDVAHIEYGEGSSATWKRTTASLEQLEVASITVAKLAVKSLELLCLYLAQYRRERAEELVYAAKDEGDVIIAKAREAGLKSRGLTE